MQKLEANAPLKSVHAPAVPFPSIDEATPLFRRPRRLISLREACEKRGISVRTYWRNTLLLPRPIKGKGKHLFLEEEVDQLIDDLLACRAE